ncbi:MAG: peroxidase [Planctomycetota bacterium]
MTEDWRGAGLDAVDTALALYAEKLTRTPSAMRESDVEALRAVGLDDVQVHDAIQVVAYFNYINRIADAVDVELEPEMPPRPPAASEGEAT